MRVLPPTVTSSVASSTVWYSPAKTRSQARLELVRGDRGQEADAAVVDADHRHAGAVEAPERAQHRPVAAEHDRDVRVRPVDELDAAPLGDRLQPRQGVAPTPSRSIVTTAARLTDGIVDPPFELGWKLGVLSLDEVEDELTVSLRAGEPGVYDALGLSSRTRAALRRPRARRVAALRGSRTTPFGVSARPASNCGFTSTSACQPGAASRSAGGSASFTEMNDTSHVTSCGANGSSVSERALTRSSTVTRGVVADLRVQLAVADVERDHARRAALEQHVGEASGRRADVEGVEARHVDPEGVERVRELVPGARDVRRRRLDLELGVLVDLLARLRVAGHAAGHDERLRLRARLGEAALDQQHVKSLLGGHRPEGIVPIARTLGCASTIRMSRDADDAGTRSASSCTPIDGRDDPGERRPSGMSTNEPSAS